MTDTQPRLRSLINIAWGIALACALLRTLITTDPFPYWDSDPSRLDLPLSGLTPADSQLIDILITACSGLALLGEALAGRAISWLFTSLVILGAAGVFLHLPPRGTLDDARVGSSWLAAMSAGLAAMHVCRDERLRRITIAAGIGVVMMLAAKGILQVTVEHRDAVQKYRDNLDVFAAAQGWLPGSAQLRAFERRLLQPEASGWFGLANIFASCAAAALIALTGWTILGLRGLRDRLVPPHCLTALGLGAALSAVALWLAGSKGGMTAAGIGLALLAGRMLLARRGALPIPPRIGGMLAVALVLSALAALVLRGIIGERMGELSLLFRWFYIEGATRIFAAHPITGVGPAGFKDAYMLAKPPISPEEVQSPHSVLFDFAATLGTFGLAWAAAVLGWIYGLGRTIVATDEHAKPTTNFRMDGWFATLVILAPMLRAAQLEQSLGSQASATMRIAGLAAWLAVSIAILAIARATAAWKWPAAIAALVLAIHGQIEVTPVWVGSCSLFMILLAAASAGVPRPGPRAPGLIAGAILLTGAIAWSVFAGFPTARWERLLRHAASQVRPIAQITTRLTELKDPSSGDSLPRITADLGALLNQPPAMNDAALGQALDKLTAQRSALAADTLTNAASLSHWHFPTLEAACRMRLAQAAALTRLGLPATDALDDAVALADRAATQPTASAAGLVANVWASRAELERRPELMDRAIEAWTKAAAMDPYGISFPLRAFRAELARGHAEPARRWALKLLELDKLQRLDPLKGLTKAERDQVEGALRLP